jgi:hypothetical protein
VPVGGGGTVPWRQARHGQHLADDRVVRKDAAPGVAHANDAIAGPYYLVGQPVAAGPLRHLPAATLYR